VSADFFQHVVHVLRLNGQKQDIALGSCVTIVGGRPSARRAGKLLAGGGERIAGQNLIRFGQAGGKKALGQGGGHAPSTEETQTQVVGWCTWTCRHGISCYFYGWTASGGASRTAAFCASRTVAV